jgi:hypothetical protein
MLPDAELPAMGQSQFDFRINLSNTLNLQGGAGQAENLIIDAETTQVDLQWMKRINHRWLAGLSIPLVHHGSGELDGFIDNYHDVLQLPQGDRRKRPQDQFQIFYQKGDEIRFDQRNSVSGVGDISLLAGYALRESDTRKVTLFTRLQFPSGEQQELTGSGRTNIAGWIAATWKPEPVLALSADFGWVISPAARTVIGEHKELIGFGSGAIQWNVNSRLNLVIQLDAHSTIFTDGNVDLLGSAVLMIMGGTFELKPGLNLEISVSEDIQVNASPDVSLQVGFSVLYGKM